jgi:hypothetical protein
MTKTQTPFTSLFESITGRAIQKKIANESSSCAQNSSDQKIGSETFSLLPSQWKLSSHVCCGIPFLLCRIGLKQAHVLEPNDRQVKCQQKNWTNK